MLINLETCRNIIVHKAVVMKGQSISLRLNCIQVLGVSPPRSLPPNAVFVS